MVNYLPSSRTTPITVTSLDVGTTMTIDAPASVPQGQPFLISGQLKRVDTGASLAGELITLSYNGTPLGSTTTRLIGETIKYEAQVQIDAVGTHTLTAGFAGSTRPGLSMSPSSASRGVGVGLILSQEIVTLIAAAIGGALVLVSR